MDVHTSCCDRLAEWVNTQTNKQAPWAGKDAADKSDSGSSSEPPRPPATKEDVAHMAVGMRCECQPGRGNARVRAYGDMT